MVPGLLPFASPQGGRICIFDFYKTPRAGLDASLRGAKKKRRKLLLTAFLRSGQGRD